MKTRYTDFGRAFSLAVLVILACSLSRGGVGEPLNRSIYVPVSFGVCEHLSDAILYVEDQRVGYLPSRRIFQFTYYPSLKRMAPEATQIRVEGYRDDGSAFLARLAVTAGGIYSANRQIELHIKKQLEKLRYKIDVRYKQFDLLLQCDTVCRRAAQRKVADANDLEGGKEQPESPR